MPALDPEQWREASPLLDEILDLPEPERAARLQELATRRPALAEDLRRLLQEHRLLAEERFLEQAPARPVRASAQAGDIVGTHRLTAPLGEGGMGMVWLGQRADGRFERQVAVKFLNVAAVTSWSEERFRREGRILGRLRHARIAALLDAGTTPSGQPYLVLEYVDGQPIDAYCDQHLLGIAARIQLFLGVVAAVEHAHAHLVIHRDLKPSNVLVDTNGEVKLLDFGIAKLLDEVADAASPAQLTQAAGPMTPLFAAPEQVTGGAITTATDVYALGGLLFLLLTGSFSLGPGPHSPAGLIKAITDLDAPLASQAASADARDRRGGADQREAVGAEPQAKTGCACAAAKRGVAPEKLRRLLQGDLDTILAKALNKQPRERYASAAALGEDLRRFLQHQPIIARKGAAVYRLRRYVRRHRTAAGLTTAVIVLLAGFLVMQTLTLRRIRRERDRADRVADFMAGIFRQSDPQLHSGQATTARQVLDHAATEIRTGLRDDPSLRAQLLQVMARAYLNLGLFSQAESLYRQGIQASQAAGTQRSRNSLLMVHDLAWAVLQQGRMPEAEGIERTLLANQQRLLGPRDNDTLATTEELAFTVCNEGKGQCAEGIQLTRGVLQAHEQTMGPQAGATLATMDNLALMLASAGRTGEAIALEQESLHRHVRKSGLQDLGTVNAMLNLGELQRDSGRVEQARATLEKLLAVETHAFAPNQVETAETKYDLASVLLRQGQPERALAFLQDALAHGLAPRTAQGLATDPLFASLRHDPRFQAIVRQVRKYK